MRHHLVGLLKQGDAQLLDLIARIVQFALGGEPQLLFPRQGLEEVVGGGRGAGPGRVVDGAVGQVEGEGGLGRCEQRRRAVAGLVARRGGAVRRGRGGRGEARRAEARLVPAGTRLRAQVRRRLLAQVRRDAIRRGGGEAGHGRGALGHLLGRLLLLLVELAAQFVQLVLVVGPAVDGGGGFGVEEANLGLEVADLDLGVAEGAGLLVEVAGRGDGEGEVVAAVWAARDGAESGRRETRHREGHGRRHAEGEEEEKKRGGGLSKWFLQIPEGEGI